MTFDVEGVAREPSIVSFNAKLNGRCCPRGTAPSWLHVFLCQGWRDEELASALQLHLRQERRALANRRSPFLGFAIALEIVRQYSSRRAGAG